MKNIRGAFLYYGNIILFSFIIWVGDFSVFAVSLGDRVEANGTVNVRQTAAGSLLGTQASGSLGVVIGGPTTATLNGTSYTWYDVNFDTGVDGWVADSGSAIGLTVVVPAMPTSPSPGSTTSPGPVQASSTVSLSWGASTGATYYDLGVVDVATGSFVVNTTTTSPSYTATLTAGKTYKWNVAAGDSAGESSFTTVLYFQTPASTPTISSVSPNPATGANTAQTLTVYGSGFVSPAQVKLAYPAVGVVSAGSQTFSATFISSSELQITPTYANDPGTWTAQVINPGNVTSSTYSFSVQAPYPVITSLSPSSASAGGAAFTLTVYGVTFDQSSVILWNGTSLTTSHTVSGGLTTSISASIPASDIVSSGSAQVTVFTPSPGGGTSSATPFSIIGGVQGTILAGFDSEFFPAHANTMDDLLKRTNLRWCGYYLDAPNQSLDTGWLGERSYLETLGWQIAPIYVGQQDAAYVAAWNAAHPNDPLSTTPPSSSQGVTDGNETIAQMGPDTGATETVFAYDTITGDYDIPTSVATGQGFSQGTIVFLDWETGDIAMGADTDYILAWCRTVAAAGYRPGVYCPYSDAATIAQVVQPYVPNVAFWVADPNWLLNDPTEFTVGPTTFPVPDPSAISDKFTGSGYAGATSWQYETGYSLETVNGIYDVDLDTSSLYGSSSQPALNVSTTALTLPSTTEGTSGTPTSFTVSGSGLGGNDTLTLTAPAGSEISQNGSSGFVTTFVLYPDANGDLSTTTVYARISAAATANVSGFLTVQDALHTSLNESVQVSGTDNSGVGSGGGDVTPPTLSITSPLNGATVTSASLSVSGTATDSGNGNDGISSVTVNGIAVNGDTASGANTANWNTTIGLYSGANIITVIATDGVGNTKQQQISVTYNPSGPVFGGLSVSGGQFQTVVSGLSAQETVVIYVSSDLKNWTPIQTVIASGSVYSFTYPVDPAMHGQYFRVGVQ